MNKIELEIFSKLTKLQNLFNFRILDENWGIRKAIPSAVDWVLHKHDKLMVLEDDVIPTENFILFMTYALNKYKNDTRIGAISGYNNILINKSESSEVLSTRLSIYPESYAWGTWKNRWQLFDYDTVKIINFSKIIGLTKISLLLLLGN